MGGEDNTPKYAGRIIPLIDPAYKAEDLFALDPEGIGIDAFTHSIRLLAEVTKKIQSHIKRYGVDAFSATEPDAVVENIRKDYDINKLRSSFQSDIAENMKHVLGSDKLSLKDNFMNLIKYQVGDNVYDSLYDAFEAAKKEDEKAKGCLYNLLKAAGLTIVIGTAYLAGNLGILGDKVDDAISKYFPNSRPTLTVKETVKEPCLPLTDDELVRRVQELIQENPVPKEGIIIKINDCIDLVPYGAATDETDILCTGKLVPEVKPEEPVPPVNPEIELTPVDQTTHEETVPRKHPRKPKPEEVGSQEPGVPEPLIHEDSSVPQILVPKPEDTNQ